MPAGSKMDLLLAKAKPISNGGCASGTAYLRRGKRLLRERVKWRRKKKKRKKKEKSYSKKRGGEEEEDGRRRRGATVRRGVGCERENPADTKVSEEGEGGGAPEQRFPCSPW